LLSHEHPTGHGYSVTTDLRVHRAGMALGGLGWKELRDAGNGEPGRRSRAATAVLWCDGTLRRVGRERDLADAPIVSDVGGEEGTLVRHAAVVRQSQPCRYSDS